MRASTQGRGGRTRGKQVYLGSYTNEEDAARAYDLAVLAFLGVDATTNVSMHRGQAAFDWRDEGGRHVHADQSDEPVSSTRGSVVASLATQPAVVAASALLS